MSWPRALAVFLGGGLGSVARYGMQHWLSRHPHTLPWGTWAVNLIGSFLIGVLIASPLDVDWKVALGAGVLGGFTTYSGFNQEVLVLLHQSPARGGAYFAMTVFACLAAGYLGNFLGHRF